ncbi:MAG: hypothetical protein Q9182_002435 [Xanthomendoza sp. 2 TL-2023]
MDSKKHISEERLPRKPENHNLDLTTSSIIQDNHPPVPLLEKQDVYVDQVSLTHVFQQLGLEEQLPMAERIFASLAAVIKRVAEQHEVNLDVRGVLVTLRRADEASRRGLRDIEGLITVRNVLDQLHLAHSSDLVEAARILANASRDGSWRLPFGQSGLLGFFLRVQATEGTEDDMLVPSLRIIGNACADTDINRELAISPDYLPFLVRHVKNRRISKVIIPVVYNICNDYERAHHALRSNGLCPALIELLADPRFERNGLLSLVCSLLEFSTQQYDVANCPEHSIKTVAELLQENDIEPDDMLLVVSTINVLLQHDRFQNKFIEQDLVNCLTDAIVRLSPTVSTDRSQISLPPVGGDPEEEVLSSLRSAITQILADVSATGTFSEKYPVSSTLVETLIRWLAPQGQEQLQICACLMLGNLARSDAVCREMVNSMGLHDRLLEILAEKTHPQVSYAVLSFLRNLALPTENKAMLGTQRSVEIISRFWSSDVNPQVQHASVSLLRQLLNGCIGNVRWLLESLSTDQDSPAYEKTYLSLLLLMFGRTDDAATKFEVARTVATICRCISSSSQGLPLQSTNAIWHRLYGMHLDIANPLAMMISQSRFPILRSEGWFALALMARTREGSVAVSEVFQRLEVFSVLVTAITGQSTNGSEHPASIHRTTSDSSGSDGSPKQTRDMEAKDRENALVLGTEVSVIRRSILEDLMRGPQSVEGVQDLMTRAQSEERLG